jgi:hypothetical protein
MGISPPGNADAVFHYVYNNDVTVINQPPVYSFTELNGIVTITVNNPNAAIRQLAIGGIFVLEPTTQNPDGMAAHIISISEQGTTIVITARMPESLEEIFDEFEFIADIDVLEIVEQITLDEEVIGVSGLEVFRNPTSHVGVLAHNANIGGITLNGQLRLYAPRIQVSLTTRGVDYLVLTTAAQVNLTASGERSFDRVFPLLNIPLTILGTGINVPVGVRVTADGQFTLEVVKRVDAEFGIRNNSPVIQVTPYFSLDFEFDARATVSLNVQARARVLWIPVYGIQGDFGRGIQTNTAMQARCPQNCFVIESFQISRVRSLTDWGILRNVQALRFDENLARNAETTFWYYSQGVRHRSCPHGGTNAPNIIDRRDELVGGWVGTYHNNFGLNGVHLSIYNDGADIRAIVNFFPVQGSSASQRSGSYHANVIVDDITGRFEIIGTTWIDRPSGWVFVNFFGTVDGNTFAGITDNNANRPFSVNKRDVAPRSDELIGEWTGTYHNNAGIMGVQLSVFSEGANIRAVVNFFPVQGSPANQMSGSYHANVSFNERSGVFDITGTTWIDRPGTWTFANFSGTVSGNAFTGVVTNVSNRSINMNRS